MHYDDENFNGAFGKGDFRRTLLRRTYIPPFRRKRRARSGNVEKLGGLSAGFNARRSVSTGSHGIITKVSAALVTIHECREWLDTPRDSLEQSRSQRVD